MRGLIALMIFVSGIAEASGTWDSMSVGYYNQKTGCLYPTYEERVSRTQESIANSSTNPFKKIREENLPYYFSEKITQDTTGCGSSRYLYLYWLKSGSACPADQTWDQSTQSCSEPPSNAPSCPEAGTKTVRPIYYQIQPDAAFPFQFSVNGCVYTIPTNGHPDIDGEGNNCVVNADNSYSCFFNGVATGDSGSPGEGSPDGCTDCPEAGTVPEDGQTVNGGETGNSSTTDPETGDTSNTTTTKETKVNPDGSSSTTTTETKTETKNGQTTTTETKTTVTRNQDGSTSTHTIVTQTNPDGSKVVTSEGNQTVGPNKNTNSGEEQEGKGQCDPTKPNYLECVKMVEQVGDGKSEELTNGVSAELTGALSEAHDLQKAFIEQENPEIGDTNSIVESVRQFIPQAAACTDLTFSYKGYTMTLSCQKLEPLRQWLGYLFGCLTAIGVAHIAFRPIRS